MMNPPKLPDTPAPVKINMEAEIQRLAALDGLKHVKQLDLSVTMTQREYYKASVVSYYRGREDGYNEVFGPGYKMRRLLYRSATIVLSAVAGAALSYMLWK